MLPRRIQRQPVQVDLLLFNPPKAAYRSLIFAQRQSDSDNATHVELFWSR